MSMIIEYGFGGFDQTKPNNNIINQYEIKIPVLPLDTFGVFATLNAVLGVWSLQDAANAVGLPPEALVTEAESWAIAGP